MRIFDSLQDFVDAAGAELGTTDWLEIDQERVNKFADATGDHQWIHVDVERAAAGPFRGTIAHGLLTLSLLPELMHALYRVDQVSMAVNYGFNKVRFISPVPVGAKIRASSSIVDVQTVPGGAQGVLSTTIEIDGSDKPACIIESIVRYVA